MIYLVPINLKVRRIQDLALAIIVVVALIFRAIMLQYYLQSFLTWNSYNMQRKRCHQALLEEMETINSKIYEVKVSAFFLLVYSTVLDYCMICI